MRTLIAGLAIGTFAASCGFAQSVLSAHSGVIHYTEGKVSVDGAAFESKPEKFTELKEKSVLATEEGRAELLLTPGVFLRVGENASVRMLSNRLSDTRVEVLSGEALVECTELLPDNQITILYKDASVGISKHGLYRFDAPPGQLRVFDGEAVVTNPSGQLTAKKGHEVMLNGGALMASKFDFKTGDELMRWAARRSGYISMANVASARSTNSYGSSYSGWTFNPYFGMYTFVPMNGIVYSPFGMPYWSPYAAYMWAPYYPGYYSPFYGGYYGGFGGYGYTPTTSVAAFHTVGRFGNSTGRYSASGTARSPGFVPGGAGSRGDRGSASEGSSGRGFGGYSAPTSAASYGSNVSSAGSAASVSSGGGAAAAGGGHGGGAGGGHR